MHLRPPCNRLVITSLPLCEAAESQGTLLQLPQSNLSPFVTGVGAQECPMGAETLSNPDHLFTSNRTTAQHHDHHWMTTAQGSVYTRFTAQSQAAVQLESNIAWVDRWYAPACLLSCECAQMSMRMLITSALCMLPANFEIHKNA